MRIGVYGSAALEQDNEVRKKAREIGRRIAYRKCELVTGGCTGLPHEVVLGAYEAGGKCIGYSPATDIELHKSLFGFPIEGFSEFIFVPAEFRYANNLSICLKYRNVLSVAASDGAVFVGGRIGSMNEFTLAYDMGKDIGILKGSGGITERAIPILLGDAQKKSNSIIIWDGDPQSLVDRLIASLS